MIWQVVKKSMVDSWDELLYVIVFNLIWLFGTLLIIPWPFVTFALFYTAKDIGEGKGIGFGKFFGYGRQTIKPAYIWGGINLVVLIGLWLNIRFYGGFEAQWAGMLQILLGAILFLWVFMQLITLGLYPRLIEPGFRLALRNAAVISARYPAMVVTLVAVIVILAVISVFFTAVAFLLPFSIIAILTNNAVEAMLKRELNHEEEMGR